MELRPAQFERQLGAEPLRPVYLVAGSEPLLVQEAADALRARAREEGYGEREVFDVDTDFDWNRLSQGMASMSLFASRRLFELRMPSGKPGKEGAEALREYCAKPPPDTVLLITTQDWSRKHAGKWTEAIAAAGHLVVFWPLKSHELGDWLQRRLRSRGLVATPDAVQQLADRVEGNLLAAAQEVDKLALLAGGSREAIGVVRMEQLVADSSRFDVFAMVDAALAGEPARAVRMLAALRAEGEQVAGLMPMVAREVLALCKLSRAAEAGRLAAAMRELHVWESKQAAYRRAAERHPPSRWEAFAAECGRIDRSAKGRGDGDPWLQLERLLVAIADARARRLLAS
ncbi:DNA polymerase III subunit delta [Arenimonas caeni]|jgi:DNA polymerase-3 subunit delta|uniref:DNA polymerase III subunit delta n=1 Tax=Arenimonas caeni TaxID=2058085 RepID=UPI002A36DC13|nr:DNA polymerase III subunit delta [Arenimonas caeni]MDY0021874.1 DNA polymerase III subunit delta [Arenimonas caeni]